MSYDYQWGYANDFWNQNFANKNNLTAGQLTGYTGGAHGGDSNRLVTGWDKQSRLMTPTGNNESWYNVDYYKPIFGAAPANQGQNPGQPAPQQPGNPAPTPWWQTKDAGDYRRQMESAFRDLQSGYTGGLGALDRYNYWQSDMVDQADATRWDLLNRYNSLDLSRLGQAYAGDYAGKNPNFQGLRQQFDVAGNRITDLRNQYAKEKARVEGFGSQFANFANDVYGRAGGFTINDIDPMTGLTGQIDDWQRRFALFDSPLDYYLNPTNKHVSDLQFSEDNIRSLMAQHMAEQERIKGEQRSLGNLYSGLDRQLDGANIRYGGTLDSLGESLAEALSRINQFDSPLSGARDQFSDLLAQFQGLEGRLGGLRTERTTALEDILAQALGQKTEASGLDLWDEAGLNERLRKTQELQDKLLGYTGGDIDDYGGRFDEILSAITGRLDELGTRRGGLEDRAQDVLGQLRGGQFRSLDDLANPQSLYDSLFGEVEQYGATQANDELQEIMNLLTGNRQRLENEVRQREERNTKAARTATASMAPEDAGWMQGYRPPEDGGGGFNADAFLRAIGLA